MSPPRRETRPAPTGPDRITKATDQATRKHHTPFPGDPTSTVVDISTRRYSRRHQERRRAEVRAALAEIASWTKAALEGRAELDDAVTAVGTAHRRAERIVLERALS